MTIGELVAVLALWVTVMSAPVWVAYAHPSSYPRLAGVLAFGITLCGGMVAVSWWQYHQAVSDVAKAFDLDPAAVAAFGSEYLRAQQ